MYVSNQALFKALSQLASRKDFQVPPYPAAALKLRSILARSDYGLSEVVDAVSTDTALAATLLRVANSAVYARSGPPVTTLARAVHRLGARSVATFSLAAAVGPNAAKEGELLDLKFRVWSRSVTCALISQALGESHAIADDEAFLAGLLHGFGRSVAVTGLETLLRTQRPARPPTVDQWLLALEPYRAPLARLVAERWGLPDTLAAALGGADQGQSASPLAELVAFADRLAGGLAKGMSLSELAVEQAASSGDLRALRALEPNLASSIDALAHPATKSSQTSPAIQKPKSALPGLVPLSLPIRDLRANAGDSSLEVVGVAQQGLALQSRAPLQEGALVRLGILAEQGELTSWFSVILCVPEGQGFHSELKLFSPSRDLLDAWSGMRQRASEPETASVSN